MHKVRVFYNSKPSQSSSFDWEKIIKTRLFRSDILFIKTSSVNILKQELTKAIAEKVDLVISVGGDGSVNLLIQSLAGTNTAFMVVPAGTANDFARELGLHNRFDKALQSIRANEPKGVDLIQVNNRYMVTNGGVGIGSKVAVDINFLRKKYAYFKKAMQTIQSEIYSGILSLHLLRGSFRYHKLKITSENFNTTLSTPLLMINNQSNIAGKFRIAPKTKNNDGTFNVSIFTHTKKSHLISDILKIRSNYKPNDNNFISFECKNLQIENLEPKSKLTFFGDGEFFTHTNRVNISIVPKAIKVYAYDNELENFSFFTEQEMKMSLSESFPIEGLLKGNQHKVDV